MGTAASEVRSNPGTDCAMGYQSDEFDDDDFMNDAYEDVMKGAATAYEPPKPQPKAPEFKPAVQTVKRTSQEPTTTKCAGHKATPVSLSRASSNPVKSSAESTGALDLFDTLNDDSEGEANQHSAMNRETSAARSVPDKASLTFSPPEDDSSDEIEEMDAPAPKKKGSSFEQLRAMKNQGGNKPSSITLLGMMKPTKPAKTLSSIDKLLAMKAGTQASDSESDEDSDDGDRPISKETPISRSVQTKQSSTLKKAGTQHQKHQPAKRKKLQHNKPLPLHGKLVMESVGGKKQSTIQQSFQAASQASAPSLDSMFDELQAKQAADEAVFQQTADKVKEKWDKDFGHCFPDLMEGVQDELAKARSTGDEAEVFETSDDEVDQFDDGIAVGIAHDNEMEALDCDSEDAEDDAKPELNDSALYDDSD